MVRTSYVLNSRHLAFFFLVMFLLIFMIVILIYAALLQSPRLIYLSLLFIALVGLIVITFVWFRKSEYGHQKIPDYSLKR